jgi:hypothetical protein
MSDSYYSNPSSSQFAGRYPSMAPPAQQSGYQSRHSGSHSMSQASGFAGSSRSSTTSQFQPPTNPNYPMTQSSHPQSQGYYPSHPRYPPSSQYSGPLPPILPGSNSAFPDYSSLEYSQQQTQYPNTTYNPTYAPSSTYPGGPTQSSSGTPRNASDPRNWVRALCPTIRVQWLMHSGSLGSILTSRQSSRWDTRFV